MKTNREKNQAYDQKQADKTRPKDLEYNWKPLEAVMREWAKADSK